MSDDEAKPPALKEERAIERESEPPVVARLIVELRSDGSRTIARGAIEDLASGERVAIEARGTTPLALASSLTASLAKSLRLVPLAARGVLEALLSKNKK
jgi:hypothetical protein